ncbi:MAG: radical SAM protein [bacterium]|nr:radical SAM protein [bacterium]
MIPSCWRLYLTTRCNSRCAYCYRGLGEGDAIGKQRFDLPVGQLLNWVDTLGPEASLFRLSGGEPSLHPELPDLIQGLVERGKHIELYSNGSSASLASETLGAVNCHCLSLDSLDAATNDALRGDRTATTKFHRAFRRLMDLGIQNVRVQITLTERSLRTLGETLDYLIDELKVPNVVVSSVISDNQDDAPLVDAQLSEAHGMIMRKRENHDNMLGLSTTFFPTAGYCAIHEDLRHLCSAFVNAEGDVHFFVGETSVFRAGNILLESPSIVRERAESMEPLLLDFLDFAFDHFRSSGRRFGCPSEYLYRNEVVQAFVRRLAKA